MTGSLRSRFLSLLFNTKRKLLNGMQTWGFRSHIFLVLKFPGSFSGSKMGQLSLLTQRCLTPFSDAGNDSLVEFFMPVTERKEA